MRYTKYSTRTLKHQDEYMWDSAEFDLILNELIPNRSITHIFDKYLNPNSSILEGGCGNGAWVKYLNDKGFDCLGVDINEVILKVAEKENLNIKKDNIENLSFPDNSFDAYLSLGVIDHNDLGPENAIKEAFRVIKPGGYFFVSTPCNNLFRKLINHPIRDMINLFYRIIRKKLYFVEYRFERKELVSYVRNGGFEILETIPNDYRLDSNDFSLGLYTDWPFLRNKNKKYQLNSFGKITNKFLKLFSPYLTVSGILVVGQKPKNNIL